MCMSGAFIAVHCSAECFVGSSSITNGKMQMANGKWQMANGKWQMANAGRLQMVLKMDKPMDAQPWAMRVGAAAFGTAFVA